jgi:hypothetical protein
MCRFVFLETDSYIAILSSAEDIYLPIINRLYEPSALLSSLLREFSDGNDWMSQKRDRW